MNHQVVRCRVIHRNYEILQVVIEHKKNLPSYEMVMHYFFRKIKHILRNVFDLNNVRIGFSADATTTINKFLLAVAKLISFELKHPIFFVVMDGPFILFAGTI
jgi:hypothetical protein